MCFQHRFETFQRQFRILMPSGSEFQTPIRDTETPRPEATGLGLRHSQVAPYSRPQMSSGVDLPDRIAGAAEVSRTSTMDGVANENRDLEFDPLTNGKPVELVPQHRSDMVELPLVWDQPGSRVEDRLKSFHNNVCGTVKNAVRMDQCFCGIRREWTSDGSQLSELIETASSDVVYMQVIPSSLSNVTPRFLAEVEDSIQCSSIVVVFVSIFASCCLDPSHKNCVLSEFSFSRFDFIHPSTLSMHSSGSRLVGGKAIIIINNNNELL